MGEGAVMRRPLTAKENNRRGNVLSALVVTLAVIAGAAVYFGYHPKPADAYNHAPQCRASLTGHWSDDDAGWFTSAKHSSGFLGFQLRRDGSFVAWRGGNGSVWVRGYFGVFGGGFHGYRGHCWGGDYGPDRFVG
jgi:hypothetical protein